MFSKNELDAYKNITAPNELFQKIENGVSYKKRVSIASARRFVSALAACFIIVVGVGFYQKNRTPDIILNGQPLESSVMFYDISPASDIRTSPVFSVPIKINFKEIVHISVSHGSIVVEEHVAGDRISLSSPTMVWWNIERSEVMPKCEMKIHCNNNVTLITLEFDSAGKIITANRITE